MIDRPLIVGADIALKHGALVDVQGNIIQTFTSTDGMKSSLESIYVRSRSIAMCLPDRCIVVIDWDRTIGSWGKGRSNAQVATLLTIINCWFACIARELKKCDVQFVAPSQVRAALNLPPQTSKEKVHELTQHLWPQSIRGTKFHKNAEVRGDCRDAFLLAYTHNITKMRS